MRQTVLRNSKGVTLVEVMISLIVLLIVFLGLMQTAMLSIDANTTNALRDISVTVAEERINSTRSELFENVLSDTVQVPPPPPAWDCPAAFTAGQRVRRSLRNIQEKDFCVRRTVTILDPTVGNNKQVDIAVGYRWKGQDFTHQVSTIIRRPGS